MQVLKVTGVNKRVNSLHAVLSMRTNPSNSIAIIDPCRSKKDGMVALLHIIVAVETEYFGLKGMTSVLNHLTSQAYVGKCDPTKVFDDS